MVGAQLPVMPIRHHQVTAYLKSAVTELIMTARAVINHAVTKMEMAITALPAAERIATMTRTIMVITSIPAKLRFVMISLIMTAWAVMNSALPEGVLKNKQMRAPVWEQAAWQAASALHQF